MHETYVAYVEISNRKIPLKTHDLPQEEYGAAQILYTKQQPFSLQKHR